MQKIIKNIVQKNNTKIVLCVLDGLGGLPVNGKTELQAANTPNLDKLLEKSECGLHTPVLRGITPGSGAAHLGLFGYDPIENMIGRGVLEAIGLGIELGPRDIAVRGNFATVEHRDGQPIVTDRRAGRISTEENRRIVKKITENISDIEGVEVNVYSGLEHRFVVVFTMEGEVPEGSDEIDDTDPQQTGKPPLKAEGKNAESKKTADIIQKFVERVGEITKDEQKANYPLLRGISACPNLESYSEIYGLKSACIATYPMYRGVSKLVGMEVLDVGGSSIADEINVLKNKFGNYDFFFIHIKKTDSYGEDGNFESKAGVIEEFDGLLPDMMSLEPDVIAITGDHSTPATMKSHSWHPVPIMINSENCRSYELNGFYEEECQKGSLGNIRSIEIMPLLLAHAGRLNKFGA